jgi:hypothetical protein
MNKFDLNAMLKAAKAPEGSQEYWDDTSYAVLAQLRRLAPASPRGRRPWFPRLAWGLAVTVACVVMALAVGYWPGEKPANDDLQNAKLIRETLAMFPNQVRAMVKDERGINLILSDDGDVPVSSPLYVRICDGKHCESFVTFSGQEIEAAGQKITVLSEASGGIILTGNQFVWSSAEQNHAGSNLKIEANSL